MSRLTLVILFGLTACVFARSLDEPPFGLPSGLPPLNITNIDWDGISGDCAAQLADLLLEDGLGTLTQMRLYSGYAMGDTGQFWSCTHRIQGAHYCLATLVLPQGNLTNDFQCSLTFAQCNIGLCIPEHCDASEVASLFVQAIPGLSSIPDSPEIKFASHCQVDTSLGANPRAIVGVILFTFIGLWVFGCTILSMAVSGDLDKLFQRVHIPPPKPFKMKEELPEKSVELQQLPSEEPNLTLERTLALEKASSTDPEPDPSSSDIIEIDDLPEGGEEIDIDLSAAEFSIKETNDNDDDEANETASLVGRLDSTPSLYPPPPIEAFSDPVKEEILEVLIVPGILQRLTNPVPSSIVSIAKCFSIPANWKRLLNPVPGEFGAFHGLRVFSMLWVIYGHTFYFIVPVGAANAPYAYNDWFSTFWAQTPLSGIFAVDSFFFLSGFLCAFFLYERLLSGKRMEWVLVYVHRIWRILPVYTFMILIYVTVMPVLGDGPFWFRLVEIVDSTSKYWWSNVLFINNFYPPEATQQCVGWGWFLAVDFQFFVVSPFLIWLYYKKPIIGSSVLLLWLAVDLTTSTTLAAVNDYSASLVVKQPGFFENFYQKPYCRASPYIVGLASGLWYSYIRRNKPNFSIHWAILYPGYVLAFGMLFTIVYCIKGVDHWTFQNVLYLGYSRFLWGLSIAYLMLTMFLGYGGLVRKFFFARVWEPIGKLTYGAYLCHPMIIWLFYFNSWGFLWFETRNTFYWYFSHALCSFGFAIVAYLFVEKPLMNIEPMLIKGSIKLIYKIMRKPLPKSLMEEMKE